MSLPSIDRSLPGMAFLFKYLAAVIVFVPAISMAEGVLKYPARIVLVIPLVLLGVFFLTATEVWACERALRYRRFLSWQEIPYEQIVRCENSWNPWYGYLKLIRFVPPWGKIYFVKVRPAFSGDPKELVNSINLRRTGVVIPIQKDDPDASTPRTKDVVFCALLFFVGVLYALILDNMYGDSQPKPRLDSFPLWVVTLQTLLYRATTWPWAIGTATAFVVQIVRQRFKRMAWISAAIVGALVASMVLRSFH